MMINMTERKIYRRLVAVLFAVCAAYFSMGHSTMVSNLHAAPAQDIPSEGQEEDLERLSELAYNLGDIFRRTAEEVYPSVVWIEAERRVEVQPRRHPFEEFFGPESEESFGPQREPEREFRQRGLGSGIIIDDEGHILTNHHVVAEADVISVKLPDGREFDAQKAGADEPTELAVIALEGELGELPVAVFGDSEELHLGEWVIAIGNPMGLDSTVSAGIVSAKGRAVGLARYENLIQTDAAINPGNSGGPLVNLRGEVVGINTAIISPTGGHMGIGLAIPVNMAKPILDAMIAGEEVQRGYLGIYGADVTPELAESFGYDRTEGALVNEVVSGSPAEEAGLEPGDIVVSWGDIEVEDFTHLRFAVAETTPGEVVQVEIFRDEEKQTLELEVGSLMEEEAPPGETWLKIEVDPVTDEVRRHFEAPDLEGVMVVDVAPDSPAVDVLNPGDVILSVNRESVTDIGEFHSAIDETTPETGVLLRVLDGRTGRSQFIRIRGR